MDYEQKVEYLKKLKHQDRELTEKTEQLQKVVADRKAIMNSLHEYNDVKDATQVVLGQLANLYGDTVSNLHKKFDLSTE